jgi:excisionase family DNA binding protein
MLDQEIENIVRRVIKEELAATSQVRNLDLLTVEDVTRLFKLPDRHAVYKLKREGKLRAVKLGDKTLRFRATEVQRFLSECENGGTSEDLTPNFVASGSENKLKSAPEVSAR